MLDSTFRHLFKERGAVKFGDFILWYKTWNLWNMKTDEVINFKTLEEAFNFKIDGKTIKEIVAEADLTLFQWSIAGGSGAGGPQKQYKFEGNPEKGGKPNYDLPAKVNTKVKVKTAEEAISVFRQMHGKSGIEHAITIDANGFVSGYGHGSRGSVVPPEGVKGDTVVHNHPKRSYGKASHFSDADLYYVSGNKNMNGIIATFEGGYHNFQKGTHFKAEEFARAVGRAQFSGANYDDAVTKWLKRNQKKYGYTYTLNQDKQAKADKKTRTTTPKIKWGADGQGSLF